MTLTRRGRWVAGAAASLVICAGAGLGAGQELPNAAEPARVIYEDERGWDCRVHGNSDCGTVDMTTCGPIGSPDGCPRWLAEPR